MKRRVRVDLLISERGMKKRVRFDPLINEME